MWGPLNKSIFVSTDKGRVIQIDTASGKLIKEKTVHMNEIFKLHITHDYTMLMTCSRDGYVKLLHPETFEEVRKY